jgi:hypothetical protein
MAVDYEAAARLLWQVLDDIDTASDVFKTFVPAERAEVNELYRSYVEMAQAKRWQVATSDGYTLTFLDLSKG